MIYLFFFVCIDDSHNGIVSAYRNDLRQIHVNHVADHIGSGVGTGRFYGVPGTGGYYPYHDGGYGGYGYGGYGHGGYGHGGYGHGGYGGYGGFGYGGYGGYGHGGYGGY